MRREITLTHPLTPNPYMLSALRYQSLQSGFIFPCNISLHHHNVCSSFLTLIRSLRWFRNQCNVVHLYKHYGTSSFWHFGVICSNRLLPVFLPLLYNYLHLACSLYLITPCPICLSLNPIASQLLPTQTNPYGLLYSFCATLNVLFMWNYVSYSHSLNTTKPVSLWTLHVISCCIYSITVVTTSIIYGNHVQSMIGPIQVSSRVFHPVQTTNLPQWESLCRLRDPSVHSIGSVVNIVLLFSRMLCFTILHKSSLSYSKQNTFGTICTSNRLPFCSWASIIFPYNGYFCHNIMASLFIFNTNSEKFVSIVSFPTVLPS